MKIDKEILLLQNSTHFPNQDGEVRIRFSTKKELTNYEYQQQILLLLANAMIEAAKLPN